MTEISDSIATIAGAMVSLLTIWQYFDIKLERKRYLENLQRELEIYNSFPDDCDEKELILEKIQYDIAFGFSKEHALVQKEKRKNYIWAVILAVITAFFIYIKHEWFVGTALLSLYMLANGLSIERMRE